MHRVVMDIWVPALATLRTEWRLAEGEWERLPGGEDSVVFAIGGTVVKLVPPFSPRTPHGTCRCYGGSSCRFPRHESKMCAPSKDGQPCA